MTISILKKCLLKNKKKFTQIINNLILIKTAFLASAHKNFFFNLRKYFYGEEIFFLAEEKFFFAWENNSSAKKIMNSAVKKDELVIYIET